MPDKDVEAKSLAQKHYEIEEGMTEIFRLNRSGDSEFLPDEPIKLLEVNQNTIASGIVPIQFGAVPASGIHYASIILEITPEEYQQIERNELKLPLDWTIGERIPKPAMSGE